MAAESKHPQAEQQQPVDAEVAGQEAALTPAVDIYETDDDGVLVVDLPGCDEGSVDITIEEGVLTVRGTVKPDDLPGLQPASAEYRVGDFERSFTVSELVDVEKVQASVKDGVLRLTLPKAEAAKPKKIEVKLG